MLNRDQEQLLVEGARHFGITLSREAVAHFSIFIDEIQRWSKIADLLSRTDANTLIRKHIVDSFSLFPHIRSGDKILDLGSGAGFPGIPVAIANPNVQVILIEARRKRANFLKEITRILHLRNTQTYEERAEKLAVEKEWQTKFDVITTRATWNISSFLQLAHSFLRQNGIAIAMKGPKIEEELILATNIREIQDFSDARLTSYALPGNEQRTLAIFTKIDHTDNVPRKTSQ